MATRTISSVAWS